MRRRCQLAWLGCALALSACHDYRDKVHAGTGGGGQGGNAMSEAGNAGIGGDSPSSASGGVGASSSALPDASSATGGAQGMLDGSLPSDGSVDGSTDGGGRPVVAVPAPVAKACITSVAAGTQTIMCETLAFILNVPERCLRTQCGLVIDVHGGTMSAAMEDKNTQMRAIGEREGYVVIQPNANIGLFNAMVDDPVVFSFAQLVVEVFHLDEDRIHMMGFSQGGYMTWRFICAHTDWLASAAPAAAAGAANISPEIGCTYTGTDLPKGKLDILYMHGEKDGMVMFANAETLRSAVLDYHVPVKTDVVSQDPQYTRTRYTSSEGKVFEFIQHQYASPSMVGVPPLGVAIMGHCYPGSDDQTITEMGQLMAFGCTPPNAFNWGEEAMRFFISHPRK